MHISFLHQQLRCVASSLPSTMLQRPCVWRYFLLLILPQYPAAFFIQPGHLHTVSCSHTVREISTSHLSRQFSALLLPPSILLRGCASTRHLGAATLWPSVFPEIQIFWRSAHALGQFLDSLWAGTETFQRERWGRGRASPHLKSNESQSGQLSCACAYRERWHMLLMTNCLARGELPNAVCFQNSLEIISISDCDQQEAI